MFSKAPRFNYKPEDNIPGPNHYDPTEPQAHWKQGVFPNVAPTKSRKVDEPTCTIQHKRVVSATGQPLALTSKANLPQADRTKSTKLEDRLTKAEIRIQDLQREKTTAQNELVQLQTELRLASQREAKLKQTLEKSDKFKEKSTKLATLQARLDELEKVHQESKVKRQKEAEELQKQLRAEKERRTVELDQVKIQLEREKEVSQRVKHRLEQVEAECKAKLSEAEHAKKQQAISSEAKLGTKQRELEAMVVKLELDSEKSKQLASQLDRDKQEAERKASELLRQLSGVQHHEKDLQRQVDTLTQQLITKSKRLETEAQTLDSHKQEQSHLEAQIENLEEELEVCTFQTNHNVDVMAKAVGMRLLSLQQQTQRETLQLEQRLFSTQLENIQLQTVAEERMSQIHELIELVKQVQEDRDSAKKMASYADQDLAQLLQLREEDRIQEQMENLTNSDQDTPEWLNEGKQQQQTSPNESYEVEQLRIDLEAAERWHAQMEGEIQELQAKFVDAATDSRESRETIASLRQQLEVVEMATKARQSEVDRLARQMSDYEGFENKLQEAISEAAEAKRELQLQQETTRTMTSALSNARIAEQAWREDRDRYASLLDETAHYQELYMQLSQQTHHLMERHALAEEEKASLSALNSSLLSHTNPHQKIMYMDRVRRELDESKQDNVTLRVEIEQLINVNQDLERELRSYRAVDVPLQRRPKVEVTRIKRTDTSVLLRSLPAPLSSSTSHYSHLPVGGDVEPTDSESLHDLAQHDQESSSTTMSTTTRNHPSSRPRPSLINSGNLRVSAPLPVSNGSGNGRNSSRSSVCLLQPRTTHHHPTTFLSPIIDNESLRHPSSSSPPPSSSSHHLNTDYPLIHSTPLYHNSQLTSHQHPPSSLFPLQDENDMTIDELTS